MKRHRGKSGFTRGGWRPALAAVVLGSLLLAAATAAPPGEAPTPAANPHWNNDGCGVCHADPANPTRIAPGDADKLCYSCHDGKRAPAETHPVGRPLDPEQFTQPAGWPLVDGRLVCMSCHDLLKQCKRDEKRPLLNPMFARGRPVGGVVKNFCSSCHREENYQRFNPHIQLEGTRIVEAKCTFCHTKLLDPDAKVRTGHPALLRDELPLCQGCHPTHVEYFNPGHVGQQLTADMLKRIEDKEYLVGARKNGRIVCTTCHNPHQQGLFDVRSELAPRALQVLKNEQLKGTVNSNQLCVACHEMSGAGSFRIKKGEGNQAAPPPKTTIVLTPVCCVDGKEFGKDSITATIRKQRIRFCSEECMRKFQVAPDDYRKALQGATTQPETNTKDVP